MKHPAENRLHEGSVMILSGTLIPESLRLNLKPYWKVWNLIESSNGHALDQDLRRIGWNLFFIGGSVRSYVLGAGGPSTARRAMQRVLNKVKSAGFNCAQVSEITASHFLGIPYVSVAAYSRHLQKGSVLESRERRTQTNAAAAWSVG